MSGFNPDEYLAKKSGGFDPDAYLAKSAVPEMGALERYGRGALKALPAAGALAGGAIGSLSLNPAGILGGGMLGAAGGKALQNIGESMLGDEKTREDIYAGPIKEAAFEAAGAGVGGLVGKGAGMVGKYVKEPAERILGRMGAPAKETAPLITEAGERLGVTPTRGMLTDDKFVQKMESGLAQTPTNSGQQVATQLENVQEGLKSAGEGALSSGKTAESQIQMAGRAKESAKAKILKDVEPAQEIYKKLEGDARAIVVSPQSSERIARNIEGLPFAKIKGSQEAGFARQISDNLRSVKSLEELRNLRSYVGKQFSDQNLSPTMREVSGEMYGRLSKLEQNSITRSALDAAANPKHGRSVAKEMIGEIKKANKIYSQVSKDLQEIGRASGMGNVKSYGDFIRKMESMPDEKFVSKLFNPSNVKNLKALEKQFPESFEVMRKAKVADIYNKSVTKGEVSISKLVSNARKMSPEAKELIFGKEADQALKDIETVYNATYQKVGPSGTPEGREFVAFTPFSPTRWWTELSASARKYILDNPDKFKGYYSKVINRELNKNMPRTDIEKMASEVKSRLKYSTAPRAAGLLGTKEDE